MKEQTAKNIIEKIAEYFETHESISGMVFGEIAWNNSGIEPKKDYTKLFITTKALLEVLEEYFKRNYNSNLTKEAFYELVKRVTRQTAYEIFREWGD